MESWSNSCKLPSLAAVAPCPHLCLAQSLSLTCPLLGLLLPLSCCCLGRSLLSHLEQNIGSWRRLSGQGHVHAHVHCGLRNRQVTLRENGGSMVWHGGSNSLRSLAPIEITVGQDQGMHQADQVKRTDQPYNTQPCSSVAGPFPLAT